MYGAAKDTVRGWARGDWRRRTIVDSQYGPVGGDETSEEEIPLVVSKRRDEEEE